MLSCFDIKVISSYIANCAVFFTVSEAQQAVELDTILVLFAKQGSTWAYMCCLWSQIYYYYGPNDIGIHYNTTLNTVAMATEFSNNRNSLSS